MDLKFSIIVPCRNSSATLPRVLAAIKQSTIPYHELIVVNDASTDESAEIAKTSGASVLNLPNNMGAGYARNFGAKKATGDVFVFIDSDVVPVVHFLEIIKDEIEKGAGGVGGEYFFSDNVTRFTQLANSQDEYFWSKLRPRAEVDFLYGGLCAFTRSAWNSPDRDFKEHKLFPQMASGEDCYICEQIKKKFKIIFRADLLGEHVTDLTNRFYRRSFLQGYTRTKSIFEHGFTGSTNNLFKETKMFYCAPLYLSLFLFIVTFNPWFLVVSAVSAFMAFKFYFRKLALNDYSLMAKILFLQQSGWGLGVLKALAEPVVDKFIELWLLMNSAFHFLISSKVSKIIFFVTNRCNFTCNWCLDKDRPLENAPVNELSIEDVKKFCVTSKNKISYLILTGGEPFLRQDLDQIVYLFSNHLSTSFVTIVSNGSFPERIEEQLERMLILCPRLKINIQLTVSDKPNEHDTVRGLKGSYALIINASERIRKLQTIYPQLIFTVATQVGDLNTSNLGDIIPDVRKRIQPNEHLITPLRKVPLLITPATPSLEMFPAFQNQISRLYPQGKSLFQLFYNQVIQNSFQEIKSIRQKKSKYYKCVAGKNLVTLYENGNVVVCENRQDLQMGNIHNYNYDLSQLLSTPQAKVAYQNQIKSKCQCDWGCAVTHNLMGDPVFIFNSLKTASLIRLRSVLNLG